jgi:D-alanyl-lipoteichoic acid acyltransferase DltB (MBOAT superfamily)
MLFNSFEFLIFFSIVTISFYLLPHKYRWLLLLISSCYFYAAFIPIYLFILFFTIIIDYLSGIYIEKIKQRHKKKLLLISIIANLLILFFFKYFNFFIDNINTIYEYLGIVANLKPLNLILPIGLSFHTFQAMSYTIEVYRGNQKAEKHFGIYALYVMFYPQLVAGPIERPQNILPQLHKRISFSYSNLTSGLEQMLWGFFKKIVIADRLAIVVNEIYNNPNEYEGLTLVMGAIFFAFQIYCDFSGYSDIAIGCAKVMGIDLMKNFNTPYFSKSITEFWKRWHISLSTWFRDYVYIPMGGNRTIKWKWYYNLIITFLLSGFWHGANWTYIVWGIYHGVLLIVEAQFKLFNKITNKYINLLLMLKSFILVMFGWIFFRANSINDAINIIFSIFNFKNYSLHQLSLYIVPTSRNTVYSIDILLSYLMIFTLIILEYIFSTKLKFEEQRYSIRLTAYTIGIVLILLIGAFNKNEFIYFQF